MQANGADKAGQAKGEGHANGSKADEEMKDAAEPSESTSADSDRYKGQLTGTALACNLYLYLWRAPQACSTLL